MLEATPGQYPRASIFTPTTMTTETMTKTTLPAQIDPTILSRILDESYGPGAWHGADLRAALSDVAPRTAFWRPGPGRHNIAELALHHAWFARTVTGQLSGEEQPPFPVDGADWFELNDRAPLSWAEIRRTVDEHQRALAAALAPRGAGA